MSYIRIRVILTELGKGIVCTDHPVTKEKDGGVMVSMGTNAKDEPNKDKYIKDEKLMTVSNFKGYVDCWYNEETHSKKEAVKVFGDEIVKLFQEMNMNMDSVINGLDDI